MIEISSKAMVEALDSVLLSKLTPMLVGSPGIGKSILINVLANELNIEVLRWNDIHVDYNMNGGEYGMGSRGRDNGGGGYLPYQSQLSSFEEFLNSGSVGGDMGGGVGDGIVGGIVELPALSPAEQIVGAFFGPPRR